MTVLVCIAVDTEETYNRINLEWFNMSKSIFNPKKSYYNAVDIKILNESRTIAPSEVFLHSFTSFHVHFICLSFPLIHFVWISGVLSFFFLCVILYSFCFLFMFPFASFHFPLMFFPRSFYFLCALDSPTICFVSHGFPLISFRVLFMCFQEVEKHIYIVCVYIYILSVRFTGKNGLVMFGISSCADIMMCFLHSICDFEGRHVLLSTKSRNLGFVRFLSVGFDAIHLVKWMFWSAIYQGLLNILPHLIM